MITRPTVLVLGAGASKDYRFPLGEELFWTVATENPRAVFKALERNGISLEQIVEFKSGLKQSGATSVDSFLESRDDLLDVGKAVIAYHLTRHENEQLLTDEPSRGREDWYRYFYNNILSDPSNPRDLEAFRRNQLTVVTYNYDRSFECWLFKALHYGLGKPKDECADALNTIQIIHPHGKLGELPDLQEGGRPYDHRVNSEDIRKAIAGIKVIHEGVDDSAEIEEAQAAIANADQVIFLGFGYHPVNVQRLELAKIYTQTMHAVERGQRGQGVRFYGTAYGLTEEEKRIQVTPLFADAGGIALGSGEETVRGFLRHRLGLFIK